MEANTLAVQYYRQKFGSSLEKAFIHFVKETGELARGIEKENPELAKMELTEMMALLFYFASLYQLDILDAVEKLYRKKLGQQ